MTTLYLLTGGSSVPSSNGASAPNADASCSDIGMPATSIASTAGSFYSPEQVAALTQLSETTIQRLCAKGTIDATKLAGRWRISLDAYHEWLEASKPRATPGVAIPQSSGRVAASKQRRFRAMVGGKGGENKEVQAVRKGLAR